MVSFGCAVGGVVSPSSLQNAFTAAFALATSSVIGMGMTILGPSSLISAEAAAREIVSGFASGGFEMHFPKRFTRWMKLLRILPERLYFRAVRAITGG